MTSSKSIILYTKLITFFVLILFVSILSTFSFADAPKYEGSISGNYEPLSTRLERMYGNFGTNAFGTSIDLFKKYDRYYYAYEEFKRMEDDFMNSIVSVSSRQPQLAFTKNDVYGYYVFSNGYYVININKEWLTIYTMLSGGKNYYVSFQFKYSISDGNNKVSLRIPSNFHSGFDIIEITKSNQGYVFNNPTYFIYNEKLQDTDLILSNKVTSLTEARAQFLTYFSKNPVNELIRSEFISINHDKMSNEISTAIAKLYSFNNIIDFTHDYVNFKPYGAKYDIVKKTLTIYGCKDAGLSEHPTYGLKDGIYPVESASYDFKIKFRQTSFYELFKLLKADEYDYPNDLVYYSDFSISLSVVNHGHVLLEKASQPPWIIRSLHDQLMSQVLKNMNLKQIEVLKLADSLTKISNIESTGKEKAIESLNLFTAAHKSTVNAFIGLNSGELVLLPDNIKSYFYNVFDSNWYAKGTSLTKTQMVWQISEIYEPDVSWDMPVVSLLSSVSPHVLGIDFSLDDVLTPLVMQNNKTYDETLEIYVINSAGKILYHPEAILGQELKYPEVIDAIKSRNTSLFRHLDGYFRKDSIVKRIGETDFYLVITVDRGW